MVCIYKGIGKEVPMPFRESSIMDERMAMIVDWQRGGVSKTELSRRYGVHRNTVKDWIDRYEAEGLEGLKDRSRAPHHHPNAMPDEMVAAVLALRAKNPTWGAKKIRPHLKRRHPEMACPAESTISELLDRHGLVKRRRRRRHVPPGAWPLSPCEAPNDVWGVDFKGWFLLGNGERCDPLSMSDLTSRYVLRLQAVERTDTEHVWPIFDAAFREFGPPRVIRSDNGAPFASTGVGGLSKLAVRLIKVGVLPERIEPGKPQQNGRHERLHLTVKQDTASPPAHTLRQQQRRFEVFRRTFNEERPHEALGQVPPATVYKPSSRPYSGREREPDYPNDHQVRRVRRNGEIKWNGELIFIGEALIGEPVGLVETEAGDWDVAYGPIALGSLNPSGKFTRLKAGARPRLEPQTQPPG
jgi:transposase InsO family protein